MDYRKDIFSPIADEFDEFSRRYTSLFSCENQAVDLLLKFLLRRKGKQMRPALVLLTSKCFGQIPDSVYHLASAVELLHQGSLIHDDVVDESEKRRGLRSANAAFDNRIAVLLGDFIVSKALKEITATDNLDSVGALSGLIGTLSEGEITQLNALGQDNLSEDLYFEIISKKTANLFSSSTSLAALLSGASEQEIKAFHTFGLIAGLCFQIMDDILDYHDTDETGKPSGNDLKEGKFTLPAIYALNSSDRDWSSHIKAIRGLYATPFQIAEVTEYTLSNGGIQYAENKMQELKKQAMDSLPAFISSDLRKAFQSYLDLIVNRQK
ncbi:MAG: polyprenyl synthetase family protein [Bacteroidetes bacterium]|nr:polyprenyl synthetase family protein [Candidatus Colenecus caballi]